MDMSLLRPLNRLFAYHDRLEDILVAYANASEILFLGLLIAAFVVVRGELAHRSAVRRAVVAAGLSAGLGLALAQVITRLVDRPRPFVAHPDAVHLFAKHAADPGFPSDHATAAYAIAVALLLHSRRWGAFALAAATVLAVTRVAMGIHYPTDVLAGAAVGALSALILNLRPGRAVVHQLAGAFGGILDGAVRTAGARRARSRSRSRGSWPSSSPARRCARRSSIASPTSRTPTPRTSAASAVSSTSGASDCATSTSWATSTAPSTSPSATPSTLSWTRSRPAPHPTSITRERCSKTSAASGRKKPTPNRAAPAP